MALCPRNADIIVMTSPLALVNLVTPVYYCARTYDVIYAVDRSIIDWVISRCTQLSHDITQLSRNVTAVIARCITVIAWCVQIIARYVTVIALCVTVVARCIIVIAWCEQFIAQCESCDPLLAQCGHHQFWNKRPTIGACPQTPLTQSILWGLPFCICPGALILSAALIIWHAFFIMVTNCIHWKCMPF